MTENKKWATSVFDGASLEAARKKGGYSDFLDMFEKEILKPSEEKKSQAEEKVKLPDIIVTDDPVI